MIRKEELPRFQTCENCPEHTAAVCTAWVEQRRRALIAAITDQSRGLEREYM